MSDDRTNPGGPLGEILWRREVELRKRIRVEQQRADATRKAQAIAKFRNVASEPDSAGFHPLEAAKGVYQTLTHGPKLPEPDFVEASLPFIGQPWQQVAALQRAPKIDRPNLAESFIPVVGPAWDAAADLQAGNYLGAAFNGTAAGLDLAPVGAAVKGARAASKGIGVLKKGSVTANAAGKALRKVGLAGKGQEIHHSLELDGIGRTTQDWRNHFAFLKVLPTEVHRRIHGSFNGLPRFGPINRFIYGTPDWMKEVPAGLLSYAGDAWENLTQPFGIAPPPRPDQRK